MAEGLEQVSCLGGQLEIGGRGRSTLCASSEGREDREGQRERRKGWGLGIWKIASSYDLYAREIVLIHVLSMHVYIVCWSAAIAVFHGREGYVLYILCQ